MKCFSSPTTILRLGPLSAVAMAVFADQPAIAAGLDGGMGLCEGSNLLTYSALAGAFIAAAAIAVAFWEKARRLAKRLAHARARLETLAEIDIRFRALGCLEPVCCVLWKDDSPRLVLHTLPPRLGVPAKLPQLFRFGAWLHPDDANRIAGNVEHLKQTGEAFIANASTIEGHVLEVSGAPLGGDVVLRFKPFSPVNAELVRLIGENKRLKQAIEDREALLDALPFPIWLRDHKGRLSWVNAAYASSVNGGGRAEVLHQQIELFEMRQRAELSRKLEAKKPGRLRLQTIVDGQVRIYDAVIAPLARGSCGAALDAAPLAIAQGELDRQTTAHSRTLNKVSTGVAIFGADKKLSYGNDALARIWNLDEEWLAQKPAASELFDLMRQKRLLPDQSNYRKWRDERIGWDGSQTMDELWHLPDGRTVHFLTDYRDDGGITFLFDDVTEKLALERQYHGLIQGQRATLDHLNEGIAVFGANGRLQLFNPAFQLLWHLPPHLVEGMPHIEEIISHCKNACRDTSLWQTAREAITGITEGREAFSGTVERTDQTHLAYAGTPLPDGGTLLTFADITDSKRIEVILLERNEALEAADRLKTAFLSHVSYELRTPLTSIIGFTDLLADPRSGDLTAKQKEYLDDIKASSQVLLTIINDILDLAVIDAGALDLKMAPISVKEVIEAAELGVRDRLSKTKLHLDINIGEGVDIVTADSNRLTQVLYNLLSNAIGFSPEGATITLGCRREKDGISFSVQDTGLGIPEEEQAMVFERFQTRSQGSRHRGAGLGLSLVKSLVELHNGRVDLRSTPGAGTTVSIFLPDRHPALRRPPADRKPNGRREIATQS